MYLCLNCSKELTQSQISYKAKFCSKSCSAKYSNARRPPVTEKTKQKITDTLKCYHATKPKYSKVSFCVMCGSIIRNRHGKVCSKICQNKLNSQTRKENYFSPPKQLTKDQEMQRRYKIHCSETSSPLEFSVFITTSKKTRSKTKKRDYRKYRYSEKRKEAWKGICIVCGTPTPFLRKTCSQMCLYKSRESNCGYSKKFKVVDSKGKECTLGSTWEYDVYQFLTNNNIFWVRPAPYKYFSPSKNRMANYFSDFYLPEYNLWIDPKNEYVQRVQEEKLNILNKELNLIYGSVNYIIEKLNQYLITY